MAAGALRQQPVQPLAHLLLGTMARRACVANGEGTRDEVEGALMGLLDGLLAAGR